MLTRDDIDAIAICTHNDTHGEIAIAALETNKHVLTEYPATRTIDHARAVARQNGRFALRVSRCPQRSALAGPPRTASDTSRKPERSSQHCSPASLRAGVSVPTSFSTFPSQGRPRSFSCITSTRSWIASALPLGSKPRPHYENLRDNGTYDSFANAVTVGFETGGIGQWNWAGGVEIAHAEEHRRIVMTRGYIHPQRHWLALLDQSGESDLPTAKPSDRTIHTQFRDDIRTGKPPIRRPHGHSCRADRPRRRAIH